MMRVAPMIVAHRGLHDRFVENSLDAFRAAVEAGCEWVECDVWPSGDGVPIVIHDPAVDRTTEGRGRVIDHSGVECQALGLASLDDLLRVVEGRAGILVEIKPAGHRAFAEAVAKVLGEYRGRWMIQSFWAENISPGDHTALLVENRDQLEAGVRGDWSTICAHYSLVDDLVVAQLHAGGRRVGSWTVNEAVDILRMIELDVDLLITDQPGRVREMVARRSLETFAGVGKADGGVPPSVRIR